MAANNKVSYEFDVKTSKLIDEFAKMDNAQKKAALGFAQTQRAIDSGARKYTRNAKNMSRDTRQMAEDVGVLSKGLSGVGKILSGLGLTVGAGQIFSGIKEAVTSSATSVASFNKSMAGLVSFLDKPEDFGKVKKEVLGLSSAFGVSTDAATEYIYKVQSLTSLLAKTAQDDMKRESLRLARASGTEIETAFSAINPIYQMFGGGERSAEYEEFTTGIDSANEAASKLFYVTKRGGIDFDQLAAKINKVAQMAGSMGYSLDEALSAVATITTVSGGGEEAMTGISAAFADIQDAIRKLGQTPTGNLIGDLEILSQFQSLEIKKVVSETAYIQVLNAIKKLKEMKEVLEEINALEGVDLIGQIEKMKAQIPEHMAGETLTGLKQATENAKLGENKSLSAIEFEKRYEAGRLHLTEKWSSATPEWWINALAYGGAVSYDAINWMNKNKEEGFKTLRGMHDKAFGWADQIHPDISNIRRAHRNVFLGGGEFITDAIAEPFFGLVEPGAVMGIERQKQYIEESTIAAGGNIEDRREELDKLDEMSSDFRSKWQNMFTERSKKEFRARVEAGEYMGETIDRWINPIVQSDIGYYLGALGYHAPPLPSSTYDDVLRGVGKVGGKISKKVIPTKMLAQADQARAGYRASLDVSKSLRGMEPLMVESRTAAWLGTADDQLRSLSTPIRVGDALDDDTVRYLSQIGTKMAVDLDTYGTADDIRRAIHQWYMRTGGNLDESAKMIAELGDDMSLTSRIYRKIDEVAANVADDLRKGKGHEREIMRRARTNYVRAASTAMSALAATGNLAAGVGVKLSPHLAVDWDQYSLPDRDYASVIPPSAPPTIIENEPPPPPTAWWVPYERARARGEYAKKRRNAKSGISGSMPRTPASEALSGLADDIDNFARRVHNAKVTQTDRTRTYNLGVNR